ncbi:MAG: peptidase M75 [Paludibacteraceae bacterium]|nr:peptidase M75 [Paludibacteraceae bacterium]
MKKNLLILGSLFIGLSVSFTSCKDDDDKDNKIPASDAYNLEYKSAYATAWGNYMSIVSNLLKDDATTLYNDWNESFNNGESYAALFKAHNGGIEGINSQEDCLSQIIDGCIDIAGEVGESKIGDPIDKWEAGDQTAALYAVESWYSWHSRDDYTNNIRSIRNAYYGTRNGAIAEHSLYNLIKNYDEALNTKVDNAIKAAENAIQAIPQPFRNNIGSQEAKDAQDACGELAEILEDDIKPIFENALIAGQDFEMEEIIKQYVDVVVVPTYKDLKDKNTALNNAVKAFVAHPTNEGFEACADAWLAAREPWEQSESFLFGPVADNGLDPNMDSWPLDQVGIVNILNSQDFNQLSWEGEYDEESEIIESAQSLRGFHTLEYLVFKDGKARTIAK